MSAVASWIVFMYPDFPRLTPTYSMYLPVVRMRLIFQPAEDIADKNGDFYRP